MQKFERLCQIRLGISACTSHLMGSRGSDSGQHDALQLTVVFRCCHDCIPPGAQSASSRRRRRFQDAEAVIYRSQEGSSGSSRSGASASGGTPQRRSTYELQQQIDELFAEVAGDGSGSGSTPAAKTCRCADLPKIVAAFEQRKDTVLLNDDEKESLDAFAQTVCRGFQTVELG